MNIKLFISILPLFGCSFIQDFIDPHIQINEQKNTLLNIEKENVDRNVSTVENTNTEKKILDVPLIRQNPELKYGCEVTSLTMVLQYAGVKVTKLQLARGLKMDNDPIRKTKRGDITNWGDPQDGFVGDITGKNMGYAVFDEPIYQLAEKYLPERAVNLTGQPFEMLLKQIKNGRPVVVWTTGDYRYPDRWESWKHQNEIITTPLDLHAVVLVGYDSQHVYLNDPLSGKKAIKVNKKQFIHSWNALKKRAVSYE